MLRQDSTNLQAWSSCPNQSNHEPLDIPTFPPWLWAANILRSLVMLLTAEANLGVINHCSSWANRAWSDSKQGSKDSKAVPSRITAWYHTSGLPGQSTFLSYQHQYADSLRGSCRSLSWEWLRLFDPFAPILLGVLAKGIRCRIDMLLKALRPWRNLLCELQIHWDK